MITASRVKTSGNYIYHLLLYEKLFGMPTEYICEFFTIVEINGNYFL